MNKQEEYKKWLLVLSYFIYGFPGDKTDKPRCICGAISYCCKDKILWITMRSRLNNYTPKTIKYEPYFFMPGDCKPRIKLLVKLIKYLRKEIDNESI